MMTKRDQANKASVAEIYASLKQLIDAYERVMDTFGSVVEDVIRMKADIIDVEKFVNEQFADAVTGRNLWQANARIHRKTAEELAIQLQILADQGCKIEMDIPWKLQGIVDEQLERLDSVGNAFDIGSDSIDLPAGRGKGHGAQG